MPVTPPSLKGSSKNKIALIVILLLFLIIIVLVFVVFYRGRPEDLVGERGKLVWWGQRDKNLVQPLIDEYESQHPEVKIDYQKQDPIDYRIRLQNLIEKGQAPDMFTLHNTWAPMFKENLDILPSNVMDQKEYSNTFYPAIVGGLTTTQGVVGMPLGYDALVLYINQDLFSTAFADPPETWDEFRELAIFLTDAPGGRIVQSGAAMSLTDNVNHWEEILALLLVQNGVHLNKPAGDRAEDAFKYYTSFSSKGVKVWDETFPDSVLAFANGKLAMLIAPSFRSNDIRKVNPNLRFITVPVPQIPQAEPESPKITYSTFWFEGVWNRSVNNDLAWDFLKFMTERDSLIKLSQNYTSQGLFPEVYPRKDMQVLLKDDAILGSVVNLGESTVSWFLAGNTKDGEGGINKSLSNAFAGGVRTALGGGRNFTSGVLQQVQTVLVKYGIANRTQLPLLNQN